MDIFETTDIGLAGALFTKLGKMKGVHWDNGRCTFLFDNKEKCSELEKIYSYGVMKLNARTLRQNYDHLMNVVKSKVGQQCQV